MREYDHQISRIMGNLEAFTIKRVKQVVIGIFHDIVMRTPVDTGCARASWRIGIGSPDLTHEKPGKKYTGATSIALRQTEKLDQIDLDKPIYITNTLPYIRRLEVGHSRQAPSGMVSLTLHEWASGFGQGFRISMR